ncbi:MAG: neutral/alkaline non-lysosomal ceramidase N-terminal domain-containing protein [bacterium]|nr:neutral/alkaline non-lysosomal ceramidase N-terminal domain-containing protein [bacterium]
MKRWLKRLAIPVAALLAFAGVYYAANYNTARYNFAVVQEGKIYRSGLPDEAFLAEMVEKRKIKTIISFLGRPTDDEKKLIETHGIRVVNIKMYVSRDPTDEQIEQFLTLVSDPANQPVLVHCRGGADRTGLMIALKRVLHDGWSLEAAEKEMSFYRNLPLFTPMPQRKLRQYVLEKSVVDKRCAYSNKSVGSFRAAADKEVITPIGQTNLAGFSPKRLSLGVHDDLYARCLILECPHGEKLAIVSLDLVGFLRYDVLKVREELRKKGVIHPDSLIIVSTHQHAGPDPIGVWGRSIPFAPHLSGSGRDEEYLASVRAKIVNLVERSTKKLEKAELSVIQASGKGYSKNVRINEDLDTSLMALVAKGDKGVIGTLVNFGVHPETYRDKNQVITADFPGVLVQKMEAEFGGTSLFVNGLCGAMVSVRTNDLKIENPTYEQRAEAVGAGLTKRLVEEAISVKPIDCSGGCLRIRKKLVKIPLTNFVFQECVKLGVLPHNRDTMTEKQEAITEVGIIDIGDLRILLVPGEMQPGFGLKIKEMTGADMVFGLANDEIGYIIATEEFYRVIDHPKKGKVDVYAYERTMSLGEETGNKIYEAFKQLVTE